MIAGGSDAPADRVVTSDGSAIPYLGVPAFPGGSDNGIRTGSAIAMSLTPHTFSETEGQAMTQAATVQGHDQTAESPSNRWLGTLALALTALGAVCCFGALAADFAPRLWAGNGLPVALLSDGWMVYTAFSLVVGVPPAALGFALGLAGLLGLIQPRAGHCSRRCLAALVMGLLSLGAVGVLLLPPSQSAYAQYGLRQPQAASQLEQLSPEQVVRTYLTSGDLSVQYWLRDAEGRHAWHEPNVVPNLVLAKPAGDVSVRPLGDRSQSDDATHRSFRVDYTTQVGVRGEPPGPQTGVALLVREPGGPWRISYLGSGMEP